MLGLRRRSANEPAGETDAGDQTPQTPSPRRYSRTRQIITAVSVVALTVLWAWLVTIVLDASSAVSPLASLRDRDFARPALVESVVVVWIVVLLVVALIGRLWVALGVVTALTALIGVVNVTKLELRNDPVYPSDVTFLTQPSFLFQMVPVSKVVLGAVGLIVLIAASWVFGWLVGKVFPTLSRTLPHRGVVALRILRVVVVLACIGLLHVASDFNEKDNPWRAAYDATGLRWRAWDQRVNYQKNGFVSGLLYNMHVTAMTEPKGYSEEAVDAIAQRYKAEAEAMNQGRTATLDKTNVVIILSESFSDPNWLKTVKFPINPIPKTEAAMANTVSGKMLAPGFGSGTANTEYELLTGQSLSQLSPQLAVPYEQLVSKYKTFPSAVSWFLAHGHTPVAIHPFSPRMYARSSVYKAFGFDKFITKDTMKNTSHGGGRFIDDQSAYNEVLDQIKSNSKPVLAHLITMQNHMPYGGQYKDPIQPTGLSPNYAKLAGQYGRGIARTDDALASFFATLKKDKEPTTVIFYGDHLPPQVYPESLIKREGLRVAHETPFMIWSNGKALPHTALPTTSPIQFLPKLFDALKVPIPPWYALLDALDKQVPAMDTGFAINAQNQKVKPSQLDPAAKKVLADYRMIMYDMSVGKRWSAKTMYADAPAG